MHSSTFFDLYPDILLELFEYFSLNELYDIFSDLMPCLTILINQNYNKLYIDQNANEDFFNRILPQINPKQIVGINHPCLITNISIYSSLHSININIYSSFLFNQFQYLIHLEQLSMQLSEITIRDRIWLSHILRLEKLKKLKLDLITAKAVLIPQRPVSISKSIYQSNTIEYLEMKIPMSWQSILSFLQHFPNLKIFRALLYQLTTFLIPKLNLLPFSSLRTLDLQGYFQNISSMITSITSSMPNLKHCRLFAMNVTDDDAFYMMNASIWKDFFQYCSYLIQVKIHFIMSIEINHHFNKQNMKDLLQTFNNNTFCEKYHFQMEQLSINRGYVTLTGDYDKKRK